MKVVELLDALIKIPAGCSLNFDKAPHGATYRQFPSDNSIDPWIARIDEIDPNLAAPSIMVTANAVEFSKAAKYGVGYGQNLVEAIAAALKDYESK